MTSVLFPHLSRGSRRPFGAALGVLAVALAAFALLRWQAALITVGATGLSLVFLLYLSEAKVSRSMPMRSLLTTAALAVGLGVGWALMTGAVVAESHDVALGQGETSGQKLVTGLGIPVGSAVLMLVPAVVVRLQRPSTRDPLDGYAVGALGAVLFTAAATLTRLAPQYATGITAEDPSVGTLLVQAGIQGVTLPLTAAALGGLVGLALWRGGRRLIVASVVVTLGLYGVMGLIEALPVLHHLQLGVHVAIAVVALLALRRGMRTAVPREPTQARAARVLTAFGAAMAAAVAAGVTAAALATPVEARFVCPPDCGRPPIGEPIESNPRFYAADGAFSVQYPGPGSAYEATLEPDGVELDFVGGDTGTLRLFGLPAEGRSPEEIAEDLIAEHYPDATTEYEIPNALVGYHPGYGVVADDYPQDANGTFTRLRLIVMVAVNNDYALVAGAVGPYHEFSRDFGTGHPSGANLQLAMDMGKYVNSFRWPSPTS
ncbi:zinc ribbon domain-containing protein [Mycobacterium sp. B14F4]|uniref:zinc ribbon domain-containing protein n=1 Tax=Mycobacterium sp. B14F4 TaxID=3153565 RepID=UPI00325DF140